jgi:lysophospholipase L1-like esterase
MRVRLALAALALLCGAPAFAQDDGGRWVAGWLSPPIAYEPQIQRALGRPFADETVRQNVQTAIAGDRMRIRFTNELANAPLRIGAATLMRLDAAGRPVPGSLVALRFGGEAGATIPAGAPYLSDPADWPVRAGERFAVSVWYPEEAAPPAHAQMVEIVGPGDQTGSAAPAADERVRAPGIIAAVDVAGVQASHVLVTFGDSITEGAGATPDRGMDWPAQLSRMLADSGEQGRCWTVANAGISGNRLLHTGRGPNALSRFDRDVLAVAGATHVVILEGINDIGKVRDPARLDQQVSAARIIGAYRQLLTRAKAAGLKVIFGTLLPYEGAAYAYGEGEQRRQTVNAWLRDNAESFDGLIDFDTAMGEPDRPAALRADLQTGDNLHPNDAGYTRMAQVALPIVLEQGCPAASPGN